MRAARSRPSALVASLLGLAFAALYAGTSRGVFVFGDDVLMYQVTAAIWDRGEVSVTSTAPHGDVAYPIPGQDGERYAKYGLGPSLVALPFYGASHPLFDRLALPETPDRFGNLRTGPQVFGTGLANAAIGGATVAVTFLLAVELGFPLLVAFSTAFCLGATTLLAHYSSTFLSEPLSALCLAVAVLGLLKTRAERTPTTGPRANRGWLAISGFAAGLAVATKVAHLVIVFPLLVWVAVLGWQRARHRGLVGHLLYWSLCFSLWAGTIATYDWMRFGSIFESGYGGEAERFTTPILVGLGGLLASPAKGIFWYCPVLVLALAGGWAFWRRERTGAFAILAASVLWLALISCYYQWHGGGSWGPRFLVPLLPLWILPAAEIFTRWRRGPGWKAAILVVVAVSLTVSVAPLLVPFDPSSPPPAESPLASSPATWQFQKSPLRASLADLPRAIATTTRKFLGRGQLGEAGKPEVGPRFPDFAFERYGSHALLVWTRWCFLISALALAGALRAATGAAGGAAQKALLSSPPQ